MTRNLKVLMVAAFALTAFGVLSASGAQAAEFHCKTKPCTATLKPDGSVGSKTAHHVFIINGKNTKEEPTSISSTCNSISGEATTEAEITPEQPLKNIAYSGCTFSGQAAEVKMNGCTYTFTAAGQVTIICPEGKKIEIIIPGCTATIGSQGPLNGISYHTIGAGETREITASALVTGITATLDGGHINCGGVNTVTSAEYTTGNTIITGEEDKVGGAHVATWYE